MSDKFYKCHQRQFPASRADAVREGRWLKRQQSQSANAIVSMGAALAALRGAGASVQAKGVQLCQSY